MGAGQSVVPGWRSPARASWWSPPAAWLRRQGSRLHPLSRQRQSLPDRRRVNRCPHALACARRRERGQYDGLLQAPRRREVGHGGTARSPLRLHRRYPRKGCESVPLGRLRRDRAIVRQASAASSKHSHLTTVLRPRPREQLPPASESGAAKPVPLMNEEMRYRRVCLQFRDHRISQSISPAACHSRAWSNAPNSSRNSRGRSGSEWSCGPIIPTLRNGLNAGKRVLNELIYECQRNREAIGHAELDLETRGWARGAGLRE